jgi:hypothetical protein
MAWPNGAENALSSSAILSSFFLVYYAKSASLSPTMRLRVNPVLLITYEPTALAAFVTLLAGAR